MSNDKRSWKEIKCRMRERSWQNSEEILKTKELHVTQNALSTVPLKLSPLELWRLK